jgi:hypothetical protein
MSTQVPGIGDRISRAISDTCKNNNLNTQVAQQRYTVEQILSGFQRTLKVPFAIDGGLIHHQWKRETGDANIRFIRKLSAQEFYQAFREMKGFLAARGIRITNVWNAVPLEMHAGTKGMRICFEARLGSIRVNSHLDIGFRGSRYSFPEAKAMKRELPVFFRMQDQLGFGFKGWVFPRETQIAEKLCTSLQRGAENTRLKDFWDVAFMSGQGIDRDLLVAEMMRVICERQLEYVLDDLMVSLPEAMSLDFIDANANAWQSFLIKNRRLQWSDFDKVMDRVRGLYGSIRQDVINKVEHHMIATSLLSEPAEKPAIKSNIARGAKSVSELKGRIAEWKAARDLPAGVIDLAEAREARIRPR